MLFLFLVSFFVFIFFFKQKMAYEMRISDWSSDVCSSDLPDAILSYEPERVRASVRARSVVMMGKLKNIAPRIGGLGARVKPPAKIADPFYLSRQWRALVPRNKRERGGVGEPLGSGGVGRAAGRGRGCQFG